MEKLLHKLPSLFETEVLKISKERPYRRSRIRFGSLGRPREFGKLSVQLDGPCRSLEHVLTRCRNIYFFSIIFHFYKEGRGMGNTGAKGDLKEQAHRHRRAHGTAKTPSAAFELRPQRRRRRRRPGGTRSCFSSKGPVGLCHPVLPRCLRLPTSRPPGEASRAAGHVPESQSFLPQAGPWRGREGNMDRPQRGRPAQNGTATQSRGFFMATRGFAQSLPWGENRFGGSHPLPLQNLSDQPTFKLHVQGRSAQRILNGTFFAVHTVTFYSNDFPTEGLIS